MFIFLFAGCTQSTGSGIDNKAMLPTNDAEVQVYYFYGKMRCETCIALQNVAGEAIAENFANNKDVDFQEVDFSERANAALAEKYEIVFSSLVIANGEEHKDITGEAFAMVMGDPAKLKDFIVQETNAFLSE